MFRVEKEFVFEAAHSLPGHDGKCARLHGHSYHGRLIAESGGLIGSGPKRGMVVDYADLAAAMEPLLKDRLDHWHLNETLPELGGNTTAERLALWIYEQVKPKVPQLVAVVIEETCTSRVEYRP